MQRRGLTACLCTAVLAVLAPWQAGAQFLSRAYYPQWMEQYESYAVSGYRDALQPIVSGTGTNLGLFSYGTSSVQGYYVQQNRNAYDPFGNYLVDGLDVFRLEEHHTLFPANGSSLYKSGLYNQLFRNLVISQDSYHGWSSQFIVGDAVRTKFTPLTLDLARLNGLRWDAASRKMRFSLVASRTSDPVSEVAGLTDPRVQPFSSYLVGGRWESTLGRALTLGTSWVGLLQVDSRVRGGTSGHGVVPSSLAGPRFVFVVISDDSPEDDHPAQVYDLGLYINGERSAIAPQVRRVQGLLGSRVFVSGSNKLPLSRDALSYLRDNRSWPSSVAGYFDVLNPDASAGTVGLFQGGQPVTVDGTQAVPVGGADLLVFLFDGLPAGTRQVEFRALVANDYSIDVATGLGRVEAATLVWGDWHNVRRAAGNVTDGSNLGWVRVDYGFPTGTSVFSLDASARVLGGEVRAELARNVAYYQYPIAHGARADVQRFAGYATAIRPLGLGRVGAEAFSVPADYVTYLPTWSHDAKGPAVVSLVDDNDDRDEWADGVDQNGVFPGLDLDDDGVIDTNVNNNNEPDYLEPFLMYYVDPDDFVYGDDTNHNGLVDARENDNAPDYPYALDSRGFHVFGDVKPTPAWRYTAGWFDIRQPLGGGRNRAGYGEVEFRGQAGAHVALRAADRVQRVWDDIPNDVAVSMRLRAQGGPLVMDQYSGFEGMGYTTDGSNTFGGGVDPLALVPSTENAYGGVLDPLAMRNSWVNTAFGRARVRLGPGLTVTNTAKLEVNRREPDTFSDGTAQGRSTDRLWAFVHKADYTVKAGDLSVTPMYKLLVEHLERPSTGWDPFYYAYHWVPIVRLDYRFSADTLFRVGLQGFPGLNELYRERSVPRQEFDATSQLVVLQNKGNYSGFDLFLSMGYRRTHRDMRTPYSSYRTTDGEYFVQVYME